ncbi:MAG TPA: DinB family protein [Vicinamibacterales bacterium]|nr:DinB family protein [Vicinamibacterales bacterium]
MNSQEAKTIANFLIADFEYEIQMTLRVIESVPNNHLDYRPDSKSKTGLGLLRHLCVEDEWLLNGIANRAFSPPPDDGDGSGIASATEAAVRYKSRIPQALNRVRELNGEQLTQVVDLLGVIQMPVVNFLALAIKHSAHHRGQLSTYIRSMGGKVPGIYGPSADTQG